MANNNSLRSLLFKNRESMQLNNLTRLNYYDWLKSLCLAMFEWVGFPETVNVRYLETALFDHGKALFFKDELRGFLCLKCTPGSDMNIYSEPLAWKIIAHGYDANIPAYQGVLIRNNDIEQPTHFQVAAFSERLAKTERITDINLNAQRTPYFITGTDKQMLTLVNLFKKVNDGDPVIYGDKSQINLDSVKVLRTDAPFIVDKLDIHKTNLWNEALTFLGIFNANTDKRERLITDEVQANDQLVQMNANVLLKNREIAAEQINEMFGLNVSVKLREDYKQDYSTGWGDLEDE